MTSRHGKSKRDEDRDFARNVLKLLERSKRDGFDESTFCEEARRVGAALLQLRNLASGFLFTDPTPDFQFRRSDGGLEALLLLEALMEGKNHPIWWFLDG